MNISKQKPLSNEEINNINGISEHIKIVNLKNYEKNNTHLEIKWGLPIYITRNEDEIWLSSEEYSKENYWVVYPAHGHGLHIKPKQFETFNEALLYGLGGYIEWLNKKKAIVENILEDLMTNEV